MPLSPKMSDTQTGRATSIEVLDLHLDYLRRDVARLVEAVGNMATRDDIRRLEGQMAQYATRDELAAVRAEIQRASVPSTIERWAGMVQKIGAALAVIGGGAVLIAHFLERVK